MEDTHGLGQPLPAWQDLPAFEPSWQPVDPFDLRQGSRCPGCGQGTLEYDGLLNLGCAVCGFSLGGCFT